MELSGESEIFAPRPLVWAALNDPDVLARCIEGVEALRRTVGDDGTERFDGKMNAKVGPVRATFAGGVALTEVDAPSRYVLVGEGKGGVAGFAKGTAEVVLTDTDAGTHLAYTVKSSVGGKLAQLGARLIEGTARGYAETFFARFKAEVETPPATGADTPAVELPVTSPQIEPVPSSNQVGDDARALHDNAPRTGLSPLIWGGVLVLGVIAVLIWELM